MALALIIGVLGLLAVLVVFAIEIADTQAKSKADVRTRVHERGVLAGALIDSLFGTVSEQVPTYARLYGGPTISTAILDKNRQTDLYLAVLDRQHNVLGFSSGFDGAARADLARSAALALVAKGRPYGLGNVLPYGSGGVINFATPFPTRYGERILLTGFSPAALQSFLIGELRRIPGVKGADNSLIDGDGTVIGATRVSQLGHRIGGADLLAALRTGQADYRGTFYETIPIADSTWRIVLAAPDGPLFASVTGLRQWVPWLLFAAFAAAAVLALAFGRGILRAAGEAHNANVRLGEVNRELAEVNSVLERRAAELARSNQELEQFASIASHDLQEPLRKVRTFTQQVTAGEGERLSEKGRDYLSRANTAAERMQRLIEDLLMFSRVSTHGRPFVPVDLGAVSQEVLDDLSEQIAEAGATVRIGPLPTVSGDPVQLRQLLQNLISNAIKFRRTGVQPEVSVSGKVTGEVAQIAVKDNGIGFEPQYARRIFRVFERLHGRSEYPGTGIGLALCRKIAERHGGTIFADSTPGQGSTFTVTLPIDQREEVLIATPHEHDDTPRPPERTPVAA